MKIILWLVLTCNLWANDGGWLMSGNQLIPIFESNISITKEILTIKREKDQIMDVKVEYTFFNPSKAKSVLVGFEAGSPYNTAEGMPIKIKDTHPHMRDFSVLLNNKKLSYKVGFYTDTYAKGGKITSDDMTHMDVNNTLNAEYVYYFDARFVKGENKLIHHYRYVSSNSALEDYSIKYILTAAKRWANMQIDDFTLILDMGDYASFFIEKGFFTDYADWTVDGLIMDKTYYYGDFVRKGSIIYAHQGMTVFHKKNFHIDGNLALFGGRIYSGDSRNDDLNNYKDVFDFRKHRLPFIQEHLNIGSHVANDELSDKILRNLPYARRGYVFKNQEIQKYYESLEWYQKRPAYKANISDWTKEEKAFYVTLDQTQLNILKNLPYAKRGYAFKKKKLKTYFEVQKWYKKDRNYTAKASDLSSAEMAWLDKIKALTAQDTVDMYALIDEYEAISKNNKETTKESNTSMLQKDEYTKEESMEKAPPKPYYELAHYGSYVDFYDKWVPMYQSKAPKYLPDTQTNISQLSSERKEILNSLYARPDLLAILKVTHFYIYDAPRNESGSNVKFRANVVKVIKGTYTKKTIVFHGDFDNSPDAQSYDQLYFLSRMEEPVRYQSDEFIQYGPVGVELDYFNFLEKEVCGRDVYPGQFSFKLRGAPFSMCSTDRLKKMLHEVLTSDKNVSVGSEDTFEEVKKHNVALLRMTLASSYSNHATHYSYNDGHDKSISIYQKVIEDNPKNYEALCALAMEYRYKEEDDKAVEFYQKAIEVNPRDISAHHYLGEYLREKNEYQKAIDIYREVLKFNPKDDDSYYYIGIIYDDMHEYDKAIEAYKKSIGIESNSSRANNRWKFRALGDTYRAKKEYQKALDVYGEALKFSPKDSDIYYMMGITYHDMHRYDEAISFYNKAIEIYPDHCARYALGNAYRAKKEYNKSIEAYKKSIEHSCRKEDAYTNMGISYDDIEEYDKAIEAYKKALEINPKNAIVYNNMALVYEQKKDYKKVIELYKKAIELDSNYTAPHFGLGIIYTDTKEYKKALACVDEAIKRNPQYFDAYYLKSYIYTLEHHYIKAILSLQEVRESNPQHHKLVFNKAMNQKALSILKNLPYAKRGVEFKDKDLKMFFEAQKWYVEDGNYVAKASDLLKEEMAWLDKIKALTVQDTIDMYVLMDEYATAYQVSRIKKPIGHDVKQEVEAVVKEIFHLFHTKDIEAINKRFIHPKYGFYHIYKPGAMEGATNEMKLLNIDQNITTIRETYLFDTLWGWKNGELPKEKRNADALFGSKTKIENLRWEDLAPSSCDDDSYWSKEGVFVHQMPYRSVLGIWKYWEKSDNIKHSNNEKRRASFLIHDVFVVTDTKTNTVFYIKKIDSKWYLTHIDNAVWNCDV